MAVLPYGIRLISPQAKIAEKRRLQCFNNLVMLNNASLFYRLEHGNGPASLNTLVEGRFVDQLVRAGRTEDRQPQAGPELDLLLDQRFRQSAAKRSTGTPSGSLSCA